MHLFPDLSFDLAQSWNDAPDEVVRAFLDNLLKGPEVFRYPSFFSFFRYTSTTITDTRDPDNFFRKRSGLRICGEFRKLLIAKARSVEKGTVFTVKWANLELAATDEDIESALGENHI